ncbi:uncharacterized protein LOC121874913 [Homarus americanus]|nr:uncharacterized protein LOC121874913 [Homarus americanus]
MNGLSKCGLCGGGFDDQRRKPLLLPACGHTCLSCLERLAQHRAYLCPTCRTGQPNGKLETLHVNHGLLELIIALKGIANDARDEKKNKNNMEAKNRHDKCRIHDGTRLMYWCVTCQNPACGECVVENHRSEPHKTNKIADVVEDLKRGVNTSILEILDDIHKVCGNHLASENETSSYIHNIGDLSKDIKKTAGKLLLTTIILESQVTEMKNTGQKLKQMEMLAEEMLSNAPNFPVGISGIRELQKYKGNVHKLREVFTTKTQLPFMKADEATSFLASARTIVTSLNNKASCLTRKVGSHWRQDVLLEVDEGKSALLRWEDRGLHLYCPRKQSNLSNNDKKPHFKWNKMLSQLQEEVKMVFMDLRWGSRDEGGRVYISLKINQPASHLLFNLCLGLKFSLLDKKLPQKEEVAGGEGMLLWKYRQERDNAISAQVQQPQQHPHNAGDVVCLPGTHKGEIKFWLLTRGGLSGGQLGSPYTSVGSLTGGMKVLTEAAAKGSLADILISDCGAVIHASHDSSEMQ